MKINNRIMIMLSMLIVFLSVILFSSMARYIGTDDQAKDKIAEIDKDYKPWFESIWSPSSKAVENIIFAAQAAAGTGFIVYYIGRKKNDKNNNSDSKNK